MPKYFVREFIDIVNEHTLLEAVGDALLFHGTAPDQAVSILLSDCIEGRTSHRPTHYSMKHGTISDRGFRQHEITTGGSVNGVSFTRNPAFARAWTQSQGPVFALDATQLRHNHRIVPVDYYGVRHEAEEFVVGDVTGLSRYLTAIFIPKGLYDELVEEDEQWLEGHKRYEPLLTHPLLKLLGQRWDGTERKHQMGKVHPIDR